MSGNGGSGRTLDYAQVVQVYRRTQSLRATARELGCSPAGVLYALQVAGETRGPVGDVRGRGGWGSFQRARRAGQCAR